MVAEERSGKASFPTPGEAQAREQGLRQFVARHHIHNKEVVVVSVNSEFNQIILDSYTQRELRMLRALAEAMVFVYGPFPKRADLPGFPVAESGLPRRNSRNTRPTA